MSQSGYFEIVQLEDGDFALQPAGGKKDHLVKISFGEEAKAFLGEDDVVVARAMIQAAIQAVSALRDEAVKRKKQVEAPKILH